VNGDLLPALLDSKPAGEQPNRVSDVPEGTRIQRDDLGTNRACRRELAARGGADGADVLRDDHVRIELVDQLRVDGVQRPAVPQRVPHGLVDLEARKL